MCIRDSPSSSAATGICQTRDTPLALVFAHQVNYLARTLRDIARTHGNDEVSFPDHRYYTAREICPVRHIGHRPLRIALEDAVHDQLPGYPGYRVFTRPVYIGHNNNCLLYTSDAADDLLCVDL